MTTQYIALLIPFGGMALGGWIAYIAISASNRENMAMIEAGMDPRKHELKKKRFSKLRMALLMICVPIGILIGQSVGESIGMEEDSASIVFAFLFGGIGLAIAYFITKDQFEKEDSEDQ